MRARRALAAGVLLATTLASGAATGDDGDKPGDAASVQPQHSTFLYRQPAPPRPFRASLEIAGLLGAGLIEYFALQETNSGDWDLDYDWTSFRKKLVGDAVVLDTNRFDTNFVTHPAAGALYYLAARGNRLGVLESFGFALGASTLWEYIGEFREQLSINDILVTPVAGMVVGEATTQLGALFDRGCATPANRFFGALFAPSTALHDWIDGLTPARPRACDAHGLPREGEHALSIFAGLGTTATPSGASVYQDLRFAMSARVVNVAAYDRPGTGWTAFADGNVVDLRGDVTLSRLSASDLVLAARVAPLGAYGRDLRRLGKGLQGHALLLGLDVGMEYAQHDYDRERDDRLDRLFVLDVFGGTGEWTLHQGTTRLHARLHGAVGYGAIDPLALTGRASDRLHAELPSATQAAGYYHAIAATIAPALRLETPRLEAGVALAYHTFSRVRGMDRYGADDGRAVGLQDDRTVVSTWMSCAPFASPLRVTARADARTRRGRAGGLTATAREVSLVAGLELAF